MLAPTCVLDATPALLPVQRTAVGLGLRRLQRPEAPFDTDATVAAALAWAREQMCEGYGATLTAVARHRCMRYECVMRLDTTHGPMYLKGGQARVDDEGALTELLWTIAPSHVPRTVAIDRNAHRWLYRALEGEPLRGALLTNVNLAEAVTTLAALQIRTMHDPAVRGHLRHREMTAVDLLREVDACVRQALTATALAVPPPAGLDGETWNAAVEILARECEAIDRLRLPLTLVLSDFWTRNILRVSERIGFIDLERSYWSYPILPLWRLLDDLARRSHAPEGYRATIEHAFIAAWESIIALPDLRALVGQLPTLGKLFALLLASHELDLEEQALGLTLPPAYRLGRLGPHISSVLEETAVNE
jgi:hypothetical protein